MTIDLSLFQTVDEDGNTVDAVKPETKSFSDVEQCIKHHAGKNDTVVDLFVSMAALGEQWDWYSLYKDWLSQCELVNEWNDNRIEDGDGVVPDERPLPVMPVRPVEVTVEQWKVSNYKILREIAYGSYQTQFDKLYVSDAEWLDYQNLIKDQYPDK